MTKLNLVYRVVCYYDRNDCSYHLGKKIIPYDVINDLKLSTSMKMMIIQSDIFCGKLTSELFNDLLNKIAMNHHVDLNSVMVTVWSY